MMQKILENIDNPESLEKLYRENKDDFSRSFEELPSELDSELINFWKIRLAPGVLPVKKENERKNLRVVVLLSLAAAILVKIPSFLPVPDLETFFSRNMAVIVFNGLILFSLWENKLFNRKALLFYASFVLILIVYLNFLPNQPGDSIELACIFSALLLWCFFAYSWIGLDFRKIEKFTGFVRFNGELLIMTGLILIAGMIFSAITIQLFSVLNQDIEKFYFTNIGLIGGVISPLVAYYLIRLYPDLTNRIAPVIAKIFTPIVLLTMVIYLISFLLAGGQVLKKREELIFFNMMLLAVMALIVFSIAELMKQKRQNILLFFSLSVLACIINFIALIEITGRISLGLTPNRIVVLGSNLLIFIHLILISVSLYRIEYKQKSPTAINSTVSDYMPVYAAWTLIVIFLIPVLFHFR